MDVALYGRDLFGEPIEPPKRGKIADNFLLPPFSVLNAREGFWQERKRAWLAMGIKSELGRGGNVNGASAGGSARPACDYSNRERGSGSPIAGTSANDAIKNDDNRKYAQTYNSGAPGALAAGYQQRAKFKGGGTEPPDYQGQEESGTSIFDPVLTELCYRWFSPKDGLILDPFAGGSVRGIVASCLGRRYLGIDLRPEQIESNRTQAAEICDSGPAPEWLVGDSTELETLTNAKADFVFSCPPYGDLERYSDDPRDLSAQEPHTFIANYRRIILKACQRLRDNRFAAFVVGDYRDPKGNYRNFVSETIAAFMAAGLHLYNEAVLVTAVGSLPIRIGKQFTASRKLGKTHQNVLVFVKGNAKAAASCCETLEVA